MLWGTYGEMENKQPKESFGYKELREKKEKKKSLSNIPGNHLQTWKSSTKLCSSTLPLPREVVTMKSILILPECGQS